MKDASELELGPCPGCGISRQEGRFVCDQLPIDWRVCGDYPAVCFVKCKKCLYQTSGLRLTDRSDLEEALGCLETSWNEASKMKNRSPIKIDLLPRDAMPWIEKILRDTSEAWLEPDAIFWAQDCDCPDDASHYCRGVAEGVLIALSAIESAHVTVEN